MTKEENILQMIIQKESWEEVIYYIVSLEGLDPWDVDLVKLTNSFIEFIKSAEELDFRIPAKIVFVAAVLLRLKSDYLSIFEEKGAVEEVLEEQKPFEDLGIDQDLIQLGIPMKRVPKRQITLDELIYALRKALSVTDRKTSRSKMWRAKIDAQISEEEDITKRIDEIDKKIDNLMEKLHKDTLLFRQLVDKWTREQIVKTFVPMLHLEQKQKIRCEQEEFFKEIYITRKYFSEEKK